MKNQKSALASQTPVFIGGTVLTTLKQFLEKGKWPAEKIFILLDENTGQYCLPKLLKSVPYLKKAAMVQLASGEQNKNIDVCQQVWEGLIQMKIERESLIINLGGGVICDMGGFIASTIKRGVAFINIPTSLMAMVDAGIGGKVAVDVNDIKNQVGLFSKPLAIFIFPDFIETLDNREIISGYAEMLKHGLIADAAYWKKLKYADFADKKMTNSLIQRSAEIKSNIVTKDFKENNIRKALNFGHTIGHAVETLSLRNDKNPKLHGEAIAVGMICETWLSQRLCKLAKKDFEEIVSFILALYKPRSFSKKNITDLIEIINHDKKIVNNKINLSLISKIGKAEINVPCSIELLVDSLAFYNNLIIWNK